MKIVINDDFGGFWLPDSFKEYALKKGLQQKSWYDFPRNNNVLVEWVESNPDEAESCTLKIVEVPDEATDWRIIEYDGLEYVLYVLDGKMLEAHEPSHYSEEELDEESDD